MRTAPEHHLLHASAVDVAGNGLLIVGASGSGKSALALELMAYGASLVSDDQTEVRETGKGLVATAPASIGNLVEARGVGLLRAEARRDTLVCLVVDMDRTEEARFPKLMRYRIGKTELPCLHRVPAPHFAASVLQMLRAGRQEPS